MIIKFVSFLMTLVFFFYDDIFTEGYKMAVEVCSVTWKSL